MLNHPGRLMAAAIGMMIFGVVMPFLMVLHIFESTFFLNVLSFISSTLGSFLGIISVALMRTRFKRKDKDGHK
jgi:cytosine/uracil/thiamine/allantoin permease